MPNPMSGIARLAGLLLMLGITGDDLNAGSPSHSSLLSPWQPHFLDIHHVQTGRGNAAFLVFPDGTTMLVDAGALQDDRDQNENYRPLKLAPAVPDNSRRPGQWIADYIQQFGPPQMAGLDYGLVTHFHTDHLGLVGPSSPQSSYGDWKREGHRPTWRNAGPSRQ